jgi:dTDP-4-dehydrorhamnose 3,5-epimerase
MNFHSSKISGCFFVQPEKKLDSRGFFARAYCSSVFQENGLNTEWRQANMSLSLQAATLRGLHFQLPPYSEVKLVRCVSGRIWDVVVDLRTDSPSYGFWDSFELSAFTGDMVYVPRGCAHGFISLVDNSEIFYLVSSDYNQSHERTLLWDDSAINILWPMPPVVISPKDSKGSCFANLPRLTASDYELKPV